MSAAPEQPAPTDPEESASGTDRDRDGVAEPDAVNDTEARYGEDESPA